MSISRLIAYFILSVLLSVSFVQAAEKLPVLVSVDWLAKNADKVKIIDMSEAFSYQKFHIEKAVWLDYAELIKPQDGLQLSGGRDFVSQILSRRGITAEDTIIIYDDIGGLEASRLYWELSMMNHNNMAILDGGSVNWVLQGSAGNAKSTGSTKSKLQQSRSSKNL